MYRNVGNDRFYLFEKRPQDASLRYHISGPVLPMESEQSGLWGRIWRVIAR
jgi:hypothetical protein